MGERLAGDKRAAATVDGRDTAASASRGGRAGVLALGIVALALAVVLVYLLSGAGTGEAEPVAASATADPAALLDEALATGTPAYVLIHSDT